MKRMIASLLIFTQLAYAGRLQDADFKTEAELISAGSSAAQLLNDSKVYVTANGLNKKLSTAITDGDIGGGGNVDNKLTNPGFEKGTTGWTASGGTFASTSTASEVFEGTKAVTWDSSAAAQTLTGTAITVGGFAGQNAELTCNVRVPSGTATHTLGVWDGTTLSSAVTIQSSPGSTNYQATTINFIAPSSGTITARFTSVAANEPSISIDDCYIGKARNIGTVSQAQLIGTVKVTGCAGVWSTTSTTFASFGTQTGCSYSVTGQALAPSTNIPAIRFASLPPGEYKLEYEGLIGSTNTGTMNIGYQVFDGTNSWRETSTVDSGLAAGSSFRVNAFSSSFSYSAPQSNITLQARGRNSAGNAALIYGTAAQPGVIRVYYFPSQSQLAVSSAQTDYDWTSYGTTSDFTGFGTVSNIQLQHSRVGSNLLIRGKFTAGTTTTTEARIALPAGLVSSNTTKIPSIQSVGTYYRGGVHASKGGSMLIEPSVAYLTLGTSSTFGISTINPLSKANGDSIASNTDQISFTATIPIQGWTSNQHAPTLVGSVTSNANGAERIERAQVTSSCTSSPCTIASQSGSWLTSITRSATGTYSINYASGTFSAAPTCVCNSSISQNRFCSTQSATTTSVSILMADQTNTLVDSAFNILCMGAR